MARPRDKERAPSLDDFMALPEEPEDRLELVRGRVVREPRPAPPHARVVSKLVHALEDYAGAHGSSASEIQQKILEYFEAGARLVWVVDPRLRTVVVHDSAREARILTGDAELDGGEVLQGFGLELGKLFDLWG